jgi:hypothetical protein
MIELYTPSALLSYIDQPLRSRSLEPGQRIPLPTRFSLTKSTGPRLSSLAAPLLRSKLKRNSSFGLTSAAPARPVFFVTPAAAASNNLRAYVVTAAIRHIRLF